MQTQEQYHAQIRATRSALIEERSVLEKELFEAKTAIKRAYIHKKGMTLTMRIHFLSEELGELCPDCQANQQDEEEECL